MSSLTEELLKFHSPGKRYSYYPPVSTWNQADQELKEEILENSSEYLSLYIHLPFCRSLCTFCGCNIKVTKNETEHLRYVDALIKEFSEYKMNPPSKGFTLIFGGGSPNALAIKALQRLGSFIKGNLPAATDSLCEIDPMSFNQEQADLFYDLGFRRFSFGVQDFDERVLANVNRQQSIDQLMRTVEILRAKEDISFGIDLLWGMPLQEEDPLRGWSEGLTALSPDWINYYPMAKVPWLESMQKAYGEFITPNQQRKYELYEKGSELFASQGYIPIGMGHFLKPNTVLDHAFKNRNIHRSVSGIFTTPQSNILGLGVSAIGTNDNYLWQNEKIIDRYLYSVENGVSPISKGHSRTKADHEMARVIHQVINENPKLSLDPNNSNLSRDWFSLSDGKLSFTSLGRHFKKNILQVLESELDAKN